MVIKSFLSFGSQDNLGRAPRPFADFRDADPGTLECLFP